MMPRLKSLIRSRPMRLQFNAMKFYLKVGMSFAAHLPSTNYWTKEDQANKVM